MPQTAALAEQKALTRRGIDALVEWVAADGALPCASSAGNIAITSGPDMKEGFYDIAKKRVTGLAYLSPTTITGLSKRVGLCVLACRKPTRHQIPRPDHPPQKVRSQVRPHGMAG